MLNIRFFDKRTIKTVYEQQTAKLSEMDADNVAAWSHGGPTYIRNCQMICRSHNRMKGNR